MEKARQSISEISRLLVATLIASLLVVIAPFQAPSQADYTSWLAAGSSIQHNNRECSLGDPNNHSTSATAIEITNSDQLWEVTDCVSNSATIYFKLANDIDVSQASTAPTNSPIGYSSSGDISFSGVLDGNNKTISGLNMSTTSYGVGLFAWLAGATVSNLVISGAFETSTSLSNPEDSAGALAVRATGGIHLISVSNRASVEGRQNVGGFIGQITGGSVTISDSLNEGNVRLTGQNGGGLVGKIDFATGFAHLIENSSNTGAIAGGSYLGGLVGQVTNDSGDLTISSSQNSGTVSGTSETVGGLMGRAGSPTNIFSSSNMAPVEGVNNTGGLIGAATAFNISLSHNVGAVSAVGTPFRTGGLIGEATTGGSIFSSHNSGHVSGARSVGGLFGKLSGVTAITSSYNTGTVSASVNITANAGGLVGESTQNVSVFESANLANVVGSGVNVGGLFGLSAQTVSLSRVFNTGSMSGNNTVGGLVGKAANLTVTESYNAGTVSASAPMDGLVGAKTGTVVTSSAYTSTDSQYLDATPVADLKIASTFVGFDFDNVWGFGACTLNDGFPILRSLGLTSNPTSSGCVGNSSSSSSQQSSSSSQQSSSPTPQTGGSGGSPAPSYVGPSFEVYGASGRAGLTLDLPGKLLLSVTAVSLGDLEVDIVAQSDGVITIRIPDTMPEGTYDLVVTSSYGQLTVQAGIKVVSAGVGGETAGELIGFSWTGAFNGNSRQLSATQITTVDGALEDRVEATTIICWGYTTAAEPKQWAVDHATQRAQAACDLVSDLRPEVRTAVRLRYGVEKRFAMRASLQFWKQ